jgi:hypothetical protein
MSHIGNLGHSAILFPAAFILCCVLLWFRRRADALALLAALTFCLAITLVAKLAFHACESRALAFGIESPSGHASFSASFYGCLVLLAASGRQLWQRISFYAVRAGSGCLNSFPRTISGVPPGFVRSMAPLRV